MSNDVTNSLWRTAGCAAANDSCGPVQTSAVYARSRITHVSEQAVSLVLLVFGGGLVVGNIVGGKLALKGLRAARVATATY